MPRTMSRPRKPPVKPVHYPHQGTTALQEAKAWVMAHAGEGAGAICPICRALVRVYQRRIHREMFRYLFGLYVQHRNKPGQFISSRELLPKQTKASSDGPLLRHWGLLEEQEIDGKGKGRYRITRKGIDWLHGREQEPVPAAIFQRNHTHEVICFSEENITAQQANQEPFTVDSLLLTYTGTTDATE